MYRVSTIFKAILSILFPSFVSLNLPRVLNFGSSSYLPTYVIHPVLFYQRNSVK